jgi:kynurenine formamidase
LVTEDLAERVAGKKILADSGFTEPNRFDPTRWEMELPGGTASGQNSYYTLYSHAGPHVDAPNHVGLPGGLDSYPLSAFSGPVKVFDVSGCPLGFSVTREYFEDKEISSGDVVLIYTAYEPPSDEESWPRVVTLTREAAEYLADIPVRAFGTDAASVFDPTEPPVVEGGSVTAQVAPIHESFLSRQIPVYEGLFNVDALLQDRRMFFVGVPLNIPEGDGMPVRPVVLVY